MNFTALKTAFTSPMNFSGMTFMGMNVTKILDPFLGSLAVYPEHEAPESGPERVFKTAFKWLVGIIVPYVWAERGALLGYIHMILAALFPIYIGSHASLRCPSSAGPKKVVSLPISEQPCLLQPLAVSRHCLSLCVASYISFFFKITVH